MPNWCEGILKIRGKKENIIKFIEEGLENVGLMGETINEKKILDEQEDYLQIKEDNTLHIKNTRRAFVYDKYGEIFLYKIKKKDICVICLDFKQAWDIDTEPLAEISVKFNVDFKIFAFESGMQFNRDIEIIQGEIIKDEVIEYEDYIWDCINPHIGG